MDTAITVIQVLLVIGFALGGLGQFFMPHDRYAKLPYQGWAHEFKPWHVKLIGVLKFSAAVVIAASLLVPSLAPLATLAAVGLALVMAGAIATHLRREEYPLIAGNLAYLALALIVAYGRLVGFAA